MGSDSPSNRSSNTPVARVSRRNSETEPLWQIGGRYIARKDTSLWDTPAASGTSTGRLRASDPIVLIEVKERSREEEPIVGFVFALRGCSKGWLVLERPDGRSPMRKQRLSDSWTIGGRFCIRQPVNVRSERNLSSNPVCDYQAGTEVVLLELGVNGREDGHGVRLRMKVAADNGTHGWISAMMPNGHLLIDTTNLLGSEVLKVSKLPAAVKTGSVVSPLKKGDAPKWQVGCQYRLLQAAEMYAQPTVRGGRRGRAPSGEVVTVERLEQAKPEQVMLAYVTLASGTSGWIRCTDRRNSVVIDTRDQGQFAKVQKSIERSESCSTASRSPPQRQATPQADWSSFAATTPGGELNAMTPGGAQAGSPTVSKLAAPAPPPGCLAGCLLGLLVKAPPKGSA